MNWFSNLLRKPTPKPLPATPAPVVAKPVPVVDFDALRRALAAASGDEAVRQAAAELGRALATTLQSPRSDDPPAVWTVAINQVGNRQIASGWLADLHGDIWLGEVAAHSRIAEIRLAAAQRINASEVLEQVAHDSREKDKRVYRYCTDTLRQRQQAAEQTRRSAELEAALRQLVGETPLPLSRLLMLEKELKALRADIKDASLDACDALLEQARTHLQQETLALRDWQLRQTDATALLSECNECEFADNEALEILRGKFDALARTMAAFPAWLTEPQGDSKLASIEARLAELSADTDKARACADFLAAPGLDAVSDPESLLNLSAAWSALPKPAHAATRTGLEAQWQNLRRPPSAATPIANPAPADVTQESADAVADEAAKVVKAPKAPPRKIDQEAMRALLDQLEQHLEAGHLADAEATCKEIDTLTAGAQAPGGLDARLQLALAALGELRGWARWSTTQARDRLVAAAEELAVGEHDIDKLAAEVPALREEWKRLNATGPSSKSQWESFDAALEKAFAPVTARRAEEAGRQAEACAAREALCAEWEAWLESMPWQHADYLVIEVRRQEIIQQWRAAPPLSFRDERILRKRFDSLIAAIDARLDVARAMEIERREQIIASAEAVLGKPDSAQATTEIKALQQSWRDQASPLRLKRGDEQKLWQRFRAACDAVFARRDALRAEQAAQRAEKVAQRDEQRQVRQACLDAFAASLETLETKDVKAALDAFRKEWGELRGGAREAADALDARARELQQQANLRLADVRRQRVRGRYETIARKAELAISVETAALAGDATAAADAARQAWTHLPRLPAPVERPLAQRLTAAVDANTESLSMGAARREEMLLDMEIVLDLASPESRAEQRRARQIARLQKRSDKPAPVEAESLLTGWYSTAAPADPEADARIQRVVDKLVDIALTA